jgi:hypothetical protein
VAAALVSVLAYGAAIAAMTDVDRDESRPLALRTLVGMLHIVQPFARLWGRLTGGRQVRGGSAPVTSTEPAWRGDRLEWLHHLARELKCNGCTVRPSGPMQVWDLAVSVSVLVCARVTTAVAWQWEPRHRIRYAPRSTWWVVAVPAVILAVTARPLGTVALAAVLIGTLGEIALLHRRLKRALEHTTEGAYS